MDIIGYKLFDTDFRLNFNSAYFEYNKNLFI